MPFTQKRMPFQNMRMTDMILHELALKASCNFNPDKEYVIINFVCKMLIYKKTSEVFQIC